MNCGRFLTLLHDVEGVRFSVAGEVLPERVFRLFLGTVVRSFPVEGFVVIRIVPRRLVVDTVDVTVREHCRLR